MKKLLVTFVVSCSLFLSGGVFANSEIFASSYSNNNKEAHIINDNDLDSVDGKFYWIPVILVGSLAIRYCSHFGFDSSGNRYYHWSCF